MYVEEAGAGMPLVCLHTAGSDGRQCRPIALGCSIGGRAVLHLVLQHPDVGQGQNPWILSPDDFGAAMRRDTAEYARVIKAANIKIEQ